MDDLAVKGRVGVRDVDRAYGGAFMIFHAHLEEAIGDLFIGLVHGKLAVTSTRVRPLVRFRSAGVARRVVQGGSRHMDWLPFDDRVKPRAEVFFEVGDPFRTLDRVRIRPLTDASIVRNALAHESDQAERRFRKELVDGRPIPPAERRPAPYLRGSHALAVTRFANLMAECVNTIRVVAT